MSNRCSKEMQFGMKAYMSKNVLYVILSEGDFCKFNFQVLNIIPLQYGHCLNKFQSFKHTSQDDESWFDRKREM